MIQLPKEFATTEAKAFRPFENPPAGPYKLIVTACEDKNSQAGKAMLTFNFDIADGQHKGAFEKFPKKFRTVLEGEGLAYFKGAWNDFKASNDKSKLVGIIDSDGRINAQKFIGLVIGGNVRDEEYTNQSGQVNMGQQIAYLFPISEMGKHEAMPPKMLKKQTGNRPTSSGPRNDAPPNADDDLPF